MKNLSMRALFTLAAVLFLAVGVAYGDDLVTFPSSNSNSCNKFECSLLGLNGNQSEPLFTAGDSVTQTFLTGPSAILGLQYDFFLYNSLGGNSGASYEDDVYVNSTLVGSFLVSDSGYSGTQQEYSGVLTFPLLQGDGTYVLSIVLQDTVPAGDGNEIFLAPGTADLIATPEPASLILLGSGALALGLRGILRRRLVL